MYGKVYDSLLCVRIAVKPQSDGEVTEQLYSEMKPGVDGANYIVKHMHDKNDYNEVRQEGGDGEKEGVGEGQGKRRREAQNMSYNTIYYPIHVKLPSGTWVCNKGFSH